MRERFKDVILLDLKIKGGAISKEMWGASRNRKEWGKKILP